MQFFSKVLLLISCLSFTGCSHFYPFESKDNTLASDTTESHSGVATKKEAIKASASSVKAKAVSIPAVVEEKSPATIDKTVSPVSVVKPKVVAKPAVVTTPVITKAKQETVLVPTPKVTVKPVVKDISPIKQSLTLHLKLRDNKGKTYSTEGALVSLKLLDAEDASDKPSVHKIDTQDKAYMPKYLAVNVGDTLAFKNTDPIQHNVFSSTNNNAFDLGTYGFGKVKEHVVKNEGVIKVYCNIHPQMSLFVLSTAAANKMVMNASGKTTFSNLAAGKYLVSIWHLRGNLEKKIEVLAGQNIVQNLVLDTTQYKAQPHLNKHGKAYKKQPPIFKDEFY